MNKEEEKLELRKLYLIQFEKFESKVFFTFLSLSITLLILHFTSGISYWWGVGGLLFITLVLDTVLQSWRKNKFNDLIKEVHFDKIKKIK